LYGMSRGGSPGANTDRLVAELEDEFDLLRLRRYMADLERQDARLAEEMESLKASLEVSKSSRSATPRDAGRLRWWWRVLATGGKVFWLKIRREMLAEEWRRCSTIEKDVRFGLLVTDVRMTAEKVR
jgi:hypothetical protein